MSLHRGVCNITRILLNLTYFDETYFEHNGPHMQLLKNLPDNATV